MPGLLRRFLPRDDDYFLLFARQAENIQKGAKALCDMLSRYTAVYEQVQSIKAIEHAGDEIAHTIIMKLNQTFITHLSPPQPPEAKTATVHPASATSST